MDVHNCGRCGKTVDLSYDRCVSCNARFDFVPYRTVSLTQPNEPTGDNGFTPLTVSTPAGEVTLPRCFLSNGLPVFGELPGEGVVYGWPSNGDGLTRRFDGVTGEPTGWVGFREPPEVYDAAKGWSTYLQMWRDAQRPSEPPYGWLADGTPVAGPPGAGELFRPLAVDDEPVLLWRCDPNTGEPISWAFLKTAPRGVWHAWTHSR